MVTSGNEEACLSRIKISMWFKAVTAAVEHQNVQKPVPSAALWFTHDLVSKDACV